MRLLIGIVLVLLAAIGGAGAAYVTRAPSSDHAEPPEPLPQTEYVALRRELIIPIVVDGRVRAHVVMGLGVHSETLPTEEILRREPILRDRLLEASFLHAAAGGFDGRFTEVLRMNRLRVALGEAASAALAPHDAQILIQSIDRRDR
ncbi:hypothetical protein [Jannaschia aquimarina]|uniref:Flagellar basal body-associated protein FliL n=1 Tax=Jannaschia aquimarina TaxID=935700 RepID=A0A0D1EEH9_9RHOB|nr:hypothetical protein [Jannaschia aquimarina]KIT14295.1 hypothetical protein jaqu_40890 [Jannaschia aquimarina]SNS50252.1 hypothetical protein SAMN05421775_101208 [Jannaschia aquimarina]